MAEAAEPSNKDESVSSETTAATSGATTAVSTVTTAASGTETLESTTAITASEPTTVTSSEVETVTLSGPAAVAKAELEKLTLNEKDINILLLGCTGVGKSTFINSFANYLTYTDFETALRKNLIILIPSKIRVTDRNGRPHQITVGQEDQNEYIKTGEAQTQDVKTYVFPIADKNVNIRLIDTPGMGDPRGIQQDDINCENILSYIGNLKELHAICFLLKPNESRDTVFFKYCISQIFSRLDKSACNNIIFCFTNTRGTDYSAGETIDVLKKNIEEIKSKPPHASIPSDRNIFCFDNECFRYLAAFKENVDLDETLEQRNIDSWEKSVKECWKLYHYITGDDNNPPIKSHNVRSTKAVNEARRIITRLSKPLADVAQLIQDNIYLLERHKENLSVDTKSLEEMKSQLYIPVNSLEVYPLNNPTTVCTTRKCADVTQIGGKNMWHYRQRCHEPCGLGGVVAKEIVGDPGLRGCAAMDGTTGQCMQCGCNFKVHMHVYYLTQQVMKTEVDPNIQMNITTKEQLLENKKKFMENLEVRQRELEQEHKVIIESSAKFAHFLQNNAITPFSDAYKEYVEYLITREKSLGSLCNADTVQHLEKVLSEYIQLKNQFDEALKSAKLIGGSDVVNPQDVRTCFDNLYKLKHNGPKIKELYEVQERQIIKAHTNKEYTHRVKSYFSNFVDWIGFGKKKNKNADAERDSGNHTCSCRHGGIRYPYFTYLVGSPVHQPPPDHRNRDCVNKYYTSDGPSQYNDNQFYPNMHTDRWSNNSGYSTGRASRNLETSFKCTPFPDAWRAPEEARRAPEEARRAPEEARRAPEDPRRALEEAWRAPKETWRASKETWRASKEASAPEHFKSFRGQETGTIKKSTEQHSRNNSKQSDTFTQYREFSQNYPYFDPSQFNFGNPYRHPVPPGYPYQPFSQYPPNFPPQFSEHPDAAYDKESNASHNAYRSSYHQHEHQEHGTSEKKLGRTVSFNQPKGRQGSPSPLRNDRSKTKFNGAWEKDEPKEPWDEPQNTKPNKIKTKTEKRKQKKKNKYE